MVNNEIKTMFIYYQSNKCKLYPLKGSVIRILRTILRLLT